MKILLLNPPFSHYASKQPPLGLAYLAAVSKSKGVEFKVIDAFAEAKSIKEIVKDIYNYRPDILGVTIATPVFDIVAEILRQIKEAFPVTVVAGGPHPSALPEETLRSGIVDVVCRGEGEETLVDLFDYLKGNKPLREIPGIAFLENGSFYSTGDRRFLNNLDRLPFPDWEGFDLRRYSSPARKKNFSLPVMSSRGCPTQCYFCYKEIFGNRYRFRSPENVVDEIEYLKTKYRIQEFSIIDDNFTLLNERAEEICKLIIERKLNLAWSIPSGMRVSPISEKLLKLMKKSGCYRVFFGAESGNPEILRSINKGITLEQIKEAVNLAKEVGLEVGVFFMVGNLGEDEEKINQTIRFAISLNPNLVQFSIATPYPGTVFYERVKKEGRFLFKKWEELGTYERPVFEHGSLTAELIGKKFKEAYRRFYLRPGFIIEKVRTIKTFKDVKNLLQGGLIFINMEIKNKN
jgi:radical SAM superfamily enzyme YgiQ (UPF0313 family)